MRDRRMEEGREEAGNREGAGKREEAGKKVTSVRQERK
jgi:hypothetical protein